MTAHALAKLLLSGPDIPVVINTGSVEDEPMEVEGKLEIDPELSFSKPDFEPSSEPHLILR